MKILLIQDHAGLEQLCQRLKSSRWLALDTEFTRESTYYAKLGLLQIATDEVIACVDPLATDITPLLELLYESTVLKIFHAGRQDLEVIYDFHQQILHPLFDTQIAAALLGHSPQMGYAALVESIAGVKLPKLHTRTNWEARPLTGEQLQYAADDVIYLRDVYRKLHAQLLEQNRSSWLAEECEALANPSLYRNDPGTAYLRLNPGRCFPPSAQPLLKALATWRERTAQTRNRPRTWIAPDNALIEIARAAPSTKEILSQLSQVTPTFMQAHGEEIVALVHQMASSSPEHIWKEPRPPSASEQGITNRMLKHIKTIATQINISPEIIATRRSITALIEERNGPLTRGWRYELIGRELIKMLNGAN